MPGQRRWPGEEGAEGRRKPWELGFQEKLALLSSVVPFGIWDCWMGASAGPEGAEAAHAQGEAGWPPCRPGTRRVHPAGPQEGAPRWPAALGRGVQGRRMEPLSSRGGGGEGTGRRVRPDPGAGSTAPMREGNSERQSPPKGESVTAHAGGVQKEIIHLRSEIVSKTLRKWLCKDTR